MNAPRPWSLAYVGVRALRQMIQSPLVQLLSVATMAVCMLVLGTATLLLQNSRSVVEGWGVEVPATVYLRSGASEAEASRVQERLSRLPEVESMERVRPEQARERLALALGDEGELLDGLETQSLPDSFELHLAESVELPFVEALAQRVEAFPEVEEVAITGAWVSDLRTMVRTLATLAYGVGVVVAGACLAIVWSTIRLGVFARREEIQILRLVGGTPAFVRGPFLVEGILQGIGGAALALFALNSAFEWVAPYLERGLALVFAAGSLRAFGPAEILVGLGLGALVGGLGSWAAVARYVGR